MVAMWLLCAPKHKTLWQIYSFAEALSSRVGMLYLSIVYYWSGSGETCD